VRPALEGVSAYKAGMTLAEAGRLAGRTDLSKLASNENLLGCSPKVAAAVQDALASPEIYPDPYCETLRAAIGARLAVDPARIVMTPGSEALIDYLFRAVLQPGRQHPAQLADLPGLRDLRPLRRGDLHRRAAPARISTSTSRPSSSRRPRGPSCWCCARPTTRPATP
jgi:hypothetical protein